MCLCVYVYIYVEKYICVCTHIYVPVPRYTYVCSCVSTYIHYINDSFACFFIYLLIANAVWAHISNGPLNPWTALDVVRVSTGSWGTSQWPLNCSQLCWAAYLKTPQETKFSSSCPSATASLSARKYEIICHYHLQIMSPYFGGNISFL